MENFLIFLIRHWRLCLTLSVLLIFSIVFLIYRVLRKWKFNPKMLVALGIFMVVIVGYKNVLGGNEPFSQKKEWVIAMANALMFAYSALFLLYPHLENKKIRKYGVERFVPIVLIVVVLFPLLFTKNIHENQPTVILCGIKYVDYLALWADAMTVVGILVAFGEVYIKIEIENKFYNVVDKYFQNADSTNFQENLTKIEHCHRDFTRDYPKEYGILLDHYKNEPKKLDYAIYFREMQKLCSDKPYEVKDEVIEKLINVYICKRKKQVRMRRIRVWLNSEIEKQNSE